MIDTSAKVLVPDDHVLQVPMYMIMSIVAIIEDSKAVIMI